jgi:hypothetical protein
MKDALKVKLYEEVLNRLACWDEGKFSRCDEPGAAESAREVLEKTKAEKFVERTVMTPKKIREKVE